MTRMVFDSPAPSLPTDWPPSTFRIIHWQKHAGSSPVTNQIVQGRFNHAALWIITLTGRATVEINGLRHILEPGSILPIRGGKHTRFNEVSFHEDWSFVFVALGGVPGQRYHGFLQDEFGFANEIPLNADPIKRALRVAKLVAKGEALMAHHWSNEAHDWLVSWNRYLEAHRLPLSAILDLEKGDPAIIEFTNRSVKEITQAKGCSRTVISRRIRERWGAPLAQILHSLRIERTKLYLRDTNLKIHEISLKVGYSSLSAFINAFKKSTRLTPLEYRLNPNRARRKANRFFDLSKTTVRELERRIDASRLRLIEARREASRNQGIEVNSAFDKRARPTPPYFSLGLKHRRQTITAPIEMTLEPFRRKCFFTYTLGGAAVMTWKKHKRVLRPGELIVHFTPNNITFSPHEKSDHWERCTVALFGPAALDKFEHVVRQHGFLAALPRDSAPVAELLRIVETDFSETSSIDRSQMMFRLLAAWHEYLDTHGNPLREEVDFSDCESRIIPYHTVKNVRELAAEVGYSRSHFSRKLRAQWQSSTPGQILRSGKLATASKLLKETDLPVSRVAADVGYSSVAGFIGAFKKKYNHTPLRYRRLAQ